MKKNHMHFFIQAMYGAIIGVSFYNFGDDSIAKAVDWDFKQFFNLIFFAFTLLIATHDWFTYHRDQVMEKEEYWPYLWQIGSVFFLGLMFNSCSLERMVYWYIAGFFYTICNWAQIKRMPENQRGKMIVAYCIHILLCVSVFFCSYFCYLSGIKPIILVITVGTVILLWVWREWIEKVDIISKVDSMNLNIDFYLDIKGLSPFNSKNSLGRFHLKGDLLGKIVNLKCLELKEKFPERFSNGPDFVAYFRNKTRKKEWAKIQEIISVNCDAQVSRKKMDIITFFDLIMSSSDLAISDKNSTVRLQEVFDEIKSVIDKLREKFLKDGNTLPEPEKASDE